MNEFTDQNSCKYADELVSYLYDEASQAERSRFEDHLVNCSSCADELADFSVVRSSIVEWRDAEFTPLAVPAIQLPVQNVVFAPEISTKSRSLLASIRAFFSLSPAWMGAGAVAALVICIGLIYVAVNFRNEPETARAGNEAKIETNSSQAKENTGAQTAIAENEQKAVSEKSSEPPIIAVKETKEKTENAAVKVSQPVTTAKSKKSVVDKTIKPTTPVLRKSNQSPPPTLMADEDEYEDNSLRLSDIFRGVGGK
jgi:hypothetical protein